MTAEEVLASSVTDAPEDCIKVASVRRFKNTAQIPIGIAVRSAW
jgi:hypothetical protein